MRLLLSCAFAYLILLMTAFGQDVEPVPKIGQSVLRDLKAGEKHTYVLTAEGTEFASFSVFQKGIDVIVRLKSPDGVKILEIDSPTGPNGVESLWHVFVQPGKYYLEIEALAPDAKPGQYELKTLEMRPSNSDDAHFVAGKMAILAGINLGNLRSEPVRAKALEKFREAAAHFEKIQLDPLRRAGGFDHVARYLGIVGARDAALQYYDRATAIYLDNEQKQSALNSMKLAQTYSPSTADAIARNEQILALAKETADRKTEAAAYREIGFQYYNVGDFARSIEATKAAIRVAREIGDFPFLVGTYGNLGILYTAQKNFSLALDAHIRSIEVQRELGQKENPETLLNLGLVYHGLGNYELAIRNFEAAYEAFEKKRAAPGMAYAISNIGSSYLEMGQTEKALEYFLRAQPMKAKFLADDPTSLYNIAAAHKAGGEPERALPFVEQAIEMLKKQGDNEALANSYVIASDIHLLAGRRETALEYANKAIELARRFQYLHHLWAGLYAAADADLALGRTAEAKSALRESTAVIDELWTRFAGFEEGTAEYLENADGPVKSLIGIAVHEGDLTAALMNAERIKARALLKVLSSGKVNVTKAMTADEKERELSLRTHLASLNTSIAGEEDPKKLEELSSKLSSARLEYAEFKLKLFGTHPELQAKRGEISVSPSDLGSLNTDPGRLSIEFVTDDDRTYAFMVFGTGSNTRVKVSVINAEHKELARKVEALRTKIASGDLSFKKDCAELYDILLKPAEPYLAGKTELVVVPDGPLWELPFQALMDARGQYLVDRLAVSYAPSLTALREMRRRTSERKGAGMELLAFGNPVVGGETAERVKRVFMGEKLEPLPEAERLVKELGKMYGPGRSKVLTGAAAREEVAKSEASKYRILQLATHGILNDVSPMYSHLLLAPGDKAAGEDGLLEAWELKDLDLNADMVILSACETARGKVSRGEGVIGMTWAAFIAGAPTTVASQWRVESRSTTELMLEFHRQLLKGKVSKAEAMRQAALKLKRTREFSHPSYWAGFIVVGDSN